MLAIADSDVVHGLALALGKYSLYEIFAMRLRPQTDNA